MRVVRDDLFRRLAAARDEIHARHAEPLTIDELARRAGVSRFHFVRLFRDLYGAPPHAYLQRVRLDRAKALLATDRPVTDVCFEVGFSSLGSFSTLFAERVGCPPGAWRRRFVQVARVPGRPELAPLIVPWCFVRRFGGSARTEKSAGGGAG